MCDLVTSLWQQLHLLSELECGLWDNVDWNMKMIADFNTEKTKLFSFDWSN